MESIWQSTCTALRQGTEPGWEDVWDYRTPLQLLLASRYPGVAPAEREDLVAEILLDLKQRLFHRYLPDRGPFRAFLCGVVRHRVLSSWKRRRKQLPLERAPEPSFEPEEEGLAIDLVAEVLGATRRWAGRQDPSGHARQVFAERLLGRHSYPAIAKRLGVAEISAKRWVRGARLEIVADVLERTFPQTVAGVDWQRLSARVFEACSRPRARAASLASIADPSLRQALEVWLDGLQLMLERLPGRETAQGLDLFQGLTCIFAGGSPGPEEPLAAASASPEH